MGSLAALVGLAGAAVRRGGEFHASWLLGVIQGIMGEEIAIPTSVRPIYNQAAQAAREALGEEAYQAALHEGSRMTVEQAINFPFREKTT